jgi:hypothetical protein
MVEDGGIYPIDLEVAQTLSECRLEERRVGNVAFQYMNSTVGILSLQLLQWLTSGVATQNQNMPFW